MHDRRIIIVPTILTLQASDRSTPLMAGRFTLKAVTRYLARPMRPGQPVPDIEAAEPRPTGARLVGPAITASIIAAGMFIVWLFGERIEHFGTLLMMQYGQNWLDTVLLLLTAVSSTPLTLPIAGYCFVGVILGYNVARLAVVMAIGSALGSFVTLSFGRYFADRPWVQKRLPKLRQHKWADGKSRTYVTCALFLGTASPLPCDVFYAALGAMRYPRPLFLCTMVAARFVRYLYLGYGFRYLRGLG